VKVCRPGRQNVGFPERASRSDRSGACALSFLSSVGCFRESDRPPREAPLCLFTFEVLSDTGLKSFWLKGRAQQSEAAREDRPVTDQTKKTPV
jgi:hypothetical protein